jgi:hypothetical protein
MYFHIFFVENSHTFQEDVEILPNKETPSRSVRKGVVN